MVGGRSLGCSTCKKRKIKCDERRPICMNCEKTQRQTNEPGKPESYGGEPAEWTSPPAFTASPPSSDSQKLCMELVHAIESTKNTGFTLELCGKHIPQLPLRIGHSKILDSSISCFLSAHRGLQRPALGPSESQHKQYSRALHHMKLALDAPGEPDLDATVAATIVLADFELFNGQTHNWITHARGTEAILSAWGPSRIQSPWALDLFIIMTSAMVAASITSRQDYFLDTPKWRNVFERAANRPSIRAIERIEIKSWRAYTRLAYVVRSMNSPVVVASPKTAERMLDLWNQVSTMKDDVNALLEDPSVVVELPSKHADIPFDTYYSFHELPVAETLCYHWKFFILISQLMQHYYPDLVSPVEAEADKIKAVVNICKCFELVRSLKPLGTFFMHSNLPRAATALLDHLRIWALSACREILESGLVGGLDMALPMMHFIHLVEEWHQPSCHQWWLLGT
ncbi:hypothetical protein B7463_g12589, partial [Scytalidium lignicola]